MSFTLKKNQKEIHWTKHIREKMKEYHLSERKLLRIFRNPERKEEGIAPGTIAVMQAGGRKHHYEIWLMYQEKDSKIIMISAWRYLGKSPANRPPIPEEALEILKKI